MGKLKTAYNDFIEEGGKPSIKVFNKYIKAKIAKKSSSN